MTSTFWVVFYVFLLLLDTGGIVFTSLRAFDDVKKLGKIKRTNIFLLILWMIALILALIGFFGRLIVWEKL